MGIVQIKPDVMPEPIGFSISVGIAGWLDGLLVTLASGGIASQDTSQVLLRLKETSFEAILGAIEKAHPHLDLAAEIALYEQWIQANNGASPLLYAAWFNIGVLFAAAGNPVNAAIAHSNVLALRPDMHGAAINLGLLLEAMGQPEQALATWQRAAQPDEARIALEVQQGRLLEKLGAVRRGRKDSAPGTGHQSRAPGCCPSLGAYPTEKLPVAGRDVRHSRCLGG